MTSPRTVALLFALAATPGRGLHFHYDGSSANASAALHDTLATSVALRNALSLNLKDAKQALSAASSTLRLEMAAVAEKMRTVNSSLVTARDAAHSKPSRSQAVNMLDDVANTAGGRVLSFMEQMDEAFTSLSLEVLAIIAQAEDLAETLVGGVDVSDLVADITDDICENPDMMMASASEKLAEFKIFLDTNTIEDIEEQLVNPVVAAADAILDPLQAAASSFPVGAVFGLVDRIQKFATSALWEVDSYAAAVVKEATSMISIAKEAISTVEQALTILGPILAPACAVVSITRK